VSSVLCPAGLRRKGVNDGKAVASGHRRARRKLQKRSRSESGSGSGSGVVPSTGADMTNNGVEVGGMSGRMSGSRTDMALLSSSFL